MKAFFTGHRYISNEIPWNKGIKQLIDLALKRGTSHFLVGMALKTDQVAAKLLTDAGIKWTAIIPCADQSQLWSKKQQQHYNKLLKSAANQIVLYPQYSPGVMQSRNLEMVK